MVSGRAVRKLNVTIIAAVAAAATVMTVATPTVARVVAIWWRRQRWRRWEAAPMAVRAGGGGKQYIHSFRLVGSSS